MGLRYSWPAVHLRRDRLVQDGITGKAQESPPGYGARTRQRTPAQPSTDANRVPRPFRSRETPRNRPATTRAHARPAQQLRSSPEYAARTARPWPSVESPTVYTDRPGSPDVVRYASVDTATHRLTVIHADTWRDKKKTARRSRFRSQRAVSAGSGRCWVRTNVGCADGFTDRSCMHLHIPSDLHKHHSMMFVPATLSAICTCASALHRRSRGQPRTGPYSSPNPQAEAPRRRIHRYRERQHGDPQPYLPAHLGCSGTQPA